MVRLFVVLGFALLAGGAYAIFDGWPYRVLERGFTEVILGGLSVVAGLILLALAVVLAEIRRLKGLVSGAMAVAALSESRADARLLPSEAPAEPMLEKAPATGTSSIGIATTLAAGAGAAVATGALIGLAKTRDEPQAKADDKVGEADETEGDGGADVDRPETIAAEPSQAPPVTAGDLDDWLLPPASPVLDAAPSDVRPDERGAGNEAEEKVDKPHDEPELPLSIDTEEVQQSADEKADEVETAAGSVTESEAKPAEDEPGTEKQEPALVPARDDQLWWPRIDRSAREETASVDDEFNALRDQLVGVVNAPEIEPPRRDRDTLDTAENWMAPRPWPPVTQPRDPGALGEAETEAADKVSLDEAKTVSAPTEEVEAKAAESESAPLEEEVPEPASSTVDAPPVEKAGPPMAEPKPGEEPAASDEGVIGAYQVGETQFTMFADGSIHARTPDGDYVFASMDELKTYLANEKDKLESGAN
ncbi:hypothetical protein ACQKLX_14650 [Bosea sp. NPDC003192]|uniref:hypothetical protein n=1 Tax=Bosea sp. NPDC003192 TaxID=3390551 RepID=UPI003CFD009E